MAALAALRRPDVSTSVSPEPPSSIGATYDTCYTERYISTPQENPDGYERSSLLTYASQLRRPLVLIHGTADDNVCFPQPEAVPSTVPRRCRTNFCRCRGSPTWFPDPVVTERLWGRIVGAFSAVLRPELAHLAVKPGAGAPPLPEPIPVVPSGTVRRSRSLDGKIDPQPFLPTLIR